MRRPNGFVRVVCVALSLAVLAGCSLNKAGTGSQTPTVSSLAVLAGVDTIPLAAEPAVVVYGSARYTFSVPAADAGESIKVTVGDVPGGVIWLTPPGFPDAAAHPIADWSLWFSPASATGGSLWTNAHRWQTFAEEQAPRLLGVTDGYAILHLTEGAQTHVLTAGLDDGRITVVTRYATEALIDYRYGYGVYAWLDTDRQLHVVKLRTAKEQVVPLPGMNVKAGMLIVPGGVMVAGNTFKLALVESLPAPNVPQGYQWIGTNTDEIAVPGTWTVRAIPGGSSQGVSATNPQDPNQKVILFDAYCAGCYLPGGMTGPQFQSFPSPLLGVADGETYTWLDDHTVAYTLPPGDANPYPTYGVTRTFSQRPGIRKAEVSLPEADRETATIILNSMRSQP